MKTFVIVATWAFLIMALLKLLNRDLSDWLRLCVPCHRKHDGSAKKAWITRRKNEDARSSK